MIQRIQTIYLLLTTITAILFLTGEIFLFEDGTVISLSQLTPGMQNSGLNVILSVLLLVVPVLSFLGVFLYKRRKLQIRMSLMLVFLILVLLGLCGYLIFNISSRSDTVLVINYKLILPVLMLIFSFLAYRGIKKDEEIVRSYDRLR